ncbi:MAG: efflux RND transporter permease subunit, partial [Candidatus Acidiferrales bacterium]
MLHRTDADLIEKDHNSARFFTEHRQIAWIVLLATVIWGWYGYTHMPERKDPDIPVRVAVATCQWPGVSAEQVEQLVTRPIEETIAENSYIHPGTAADYGIKSLSMPGVSIVYVQLAESISDTKKQFNDINLKLIALNNQLPQGAGPIRFQSDFGDTAALMLTVASPAIDDIEIDLRARGVKQAIENSRKSLSPAAAAQRVSIVFGFPQSVSSSAVHRGFDEFVRLAVKEGIIRDPRLVEGPGFAGVDASSSFNDMQISEYGQRYVRERLHESEIHPDAWGPMFIH